MQHRFRQTADKIATKLKALQKTVFMRRQPLAQWELALLGQQAPYPAPFIEDWQTVPVGSVWGRWNENFLMKNTLTIPDDWQSAHSLALHLPLGDANDYFPHPEALITLNGEPFATVDTRHMTVLLPSRFCAPGQYALQLHGWTGLGGSLNGDLVPRLFMGECALVQINRPLEAFITLSQMALDTVKALDPNHPTYSALLNVLDDTFMILDTHEPIRESVAATLDAAAAHLKTSVKDVGHALPLEVYAVGHAHIDTAWLWTLAQTRQKVSRTFHTVLHLMDQYPDYHYAQSQPQLYEYFREQHPEAFEQIKARVAEGRWEPLGGMWIESDINLAGAESLIRQFVLGRRYFREQFGAEADSPILWLPDVFGFAASLPQIIAGAGIKYLFTIKPRWNEQNTLPHDTFWWQGIDGTRILTHMSTVPADGVERYPATYNADPTPQAMIGAWNKLQDKAAPPLMLMAYGWGDGGGGPTPQMLDRIALMADFPALPHIRPTRAIDFFTALEAAYKGKKLPVWFDEIYLETHRGTYTTQAMIKAGNAKLERLLHDVEFLAAFAAYDDPDYTYPRAGIDEAWRVVCLHQFHDILPGSSIAQVYADAREAYAATESTLLALRDAALQSLTRNMAGEVIAVNTASVFNQALMVWPSDGALFYPKGYLLPYSLQVMYEPMELDLIPVTASETHLENQVMRVEFNAAGDIVRIFRKHTHRELLPVGQVANQFQAFEDRPTNYDAWNIDPHFEDKVWLADPAISIEVLEAGGLRGSVKITRKLLHSTIVQTISLESQSQLTFDTQIDWREQHMLLKVAFPVDILSPRATYGIQWGHIERPTYRNTPWDAAKYEVPFHGWFGLAEPFFGVWLLADTKFGADVHENVMRLTLLRGATFPDPNTDQGQHSIRYGLSSFLSGVPPYEYSRAFNHPPLVYEQQPKPEHTLTAKGLFKPSVWAVVETVKLAESDGDLIVRLYNPRGHLITPPELERLLIFTFIPEAVWRTNLLEEPLAEVPLGEDGAIAFSDMRLKPFEIVTLRVRPRRENGRVVWRQ